MSPDTTINRMPDASRLSLVCLAHAEQEEAMLGATIESLRELRAALVGGDLAALGQALERQGHTARAAEELRVTRERLRCDAAAALGMHPASVTLERVAARLPREAAVRLTACRQRLIRMASEVDELNRGNAALVRHSMDFLHRLLVEITGGEPNATRYGPTGVRGTSVCGSLIEARG
jgi:hypothetical protein